MTVPSKEQPPKTVPHVDSVKNVEDTATVENTEDLDNDESRDTGSFKATLPELGGFLTKDGKPYRPADSAEEAEEPAPEIPIYLDDSSAGNSRWATLASTLAIVLGIALIMTGLLFYVLSGDAIGNAGDLVDVLRTNI